MSINKIITIVLGTRPEALKLAPIIKLFRNTKAITTRVVITGQHKEMLNQVKDLFRFKVDSDLSIMKSNQTLTYITNKTLNGLEKEFAAFRPSLVMVQGDTSSAYAASMASFYKKIPIAHVEAGLRTNDIYDPYPEEMNRRLISQLATLNFAPTPNSEQNLKLDNVPGKIFVTGNTIIDSLLEISQKARPFMVESIKWKKNKILLTTIHRRENRGEKLLDIIRALKKIVLSNKNVQIVIPMHRNPEIRKVFNNEIGQISNIFLIEALDYDELVFAMKNSYLLLTDSGGLQEEAPTFGKPVFILRNSTERVEALNSGTAKLVGTNTDNIFESVNEIINNDAIYKSMTNIRNPFGDGNASKRIVEHCLNYIYNIS